MNWKSPLPKQPLRKTFKRLLLKLILRSSHRRCSVRKGVLRNFSKLTGKQFPVKVPVNFAKFLGTPFLQNASGQLLLNIKCKELPLTTLLLPGNRIKFLYFM